MKSVDRETDANARFFTRTARARSWNSLANCDSVRARHSLYLPTWLAGWLTAWSGCIHPGRQYRSNVHTIQLHPAAPRHQRIITTMIIIRCTSESDSAPIGIEFKPFDGRGRRRRHHL